MRKPIFIRRNSDGEIRKSKWQEGSRFWWEEGNASCDCNRSIAFGDATVSSAVCGDNRYDTVNEDGSDYDGWEDGE